MTIKGDWNNQPPFCLIWITTSCDGEKSFSLKQWTMSTVIPNAIGGGIFVATENYMARILHSLCSFRMTDYCFRGCCAYNAFYYSVTCLNVSNRAFAIACIFSLSVFTTCLSYVAMPLVSSSTSLTCVSTAALRPFLMAGTISL